MSQDKPIKLNDGLQTLDITKALKNSSVAGLEHLTTEGLHTTGFGNVLAGVVNPTHGLVQVVRKTTQPRSSIPPKPIPSQGKK